MAALAGPLIGGLAAGAASSAFAKRPRLPPTILPSINAGGLKSTVGGTTERPVFGVTSSGERQGLITGLRGALTGRAGEIRGLLPQVAPGFGRLTEAGLQTFQSARDRLENRRLRAVGNLRENLGRRRVLGSSFATSALASAEAEFEQAEREFDAQEAQFRATSFLQELDLTNKLMGEAAAFDIESFNVALNELNLQAEFATRLATGTVGAMQNSANLQTEIMNQNIAAQNKIFGGSMQPFIDQLQNTVTSKVTEIFGG